MKVQHVKIKDFKCLKNVEKEISGKNILLVGDNGVGKSSFIQFLKIALGDQTSIPPNATGEGEVVTDKDGKQFIFSVKFKDGKPVVTITTPDGMKDSRKSAIASVVGAMDFDIDNFVELSKSDKGRRQQVEIFKSFLSDEVRQELARYEANIKANYDERTEINRSIKDLDANIRQHPLYNLIGGGTKFEKVNIDDVYASLKVATEKNNKIIEAKGKADKILSDKQRAIGERDLLMSKLAQIETDISELESKEKIAEKWLSENQTTDVSEFEQRIKEATQKNNDFEAAEKLRKEITLLEKSKEEAGELTAKIESEKGLIESAIKDMDSPVEGLMFDDSQLLYNGVPVSPDSLSTSEIMELGIRMKMAENPELGIIFLERGESLGAQRFAEIQSIAERSGWQLIIEEVKRGQDKLSIEIIGE